MKRFKAQAVAWFLVAAAAIAAGTTFYVANDTTQPVPVGGVCKNGDPGYYPGQPAIAQFDSHGSLIMSCPDGTCSGGGSSGAGTTIDGGRLGALDWLDGGNLTCFEGGAPWSVSGTVTANQGGTWTVNAVQSGSWALSGNTNTNTAQVNGNTVNTGTGTASSGTQRVAVSSDSSLTCNAGTNLNTSALALDATVAKLTLAQASTTSTQTGPLVQCAVTTSAPTYTTAQTDPLSCTTTGGLRVDGSGVTQPVSGTVTSNQGGSNWSVNVAQVAGSTTSTAASGIQKVGIVGGAGNSLETNAGTLDLNIKAVNASAVATAAGGTIKVGVVGSAAAAFDAPNAGTLPANVVQDGLETETIDTSPTAAAAGSARRFAGSTEGVLYVQEGGPKRFSCFVNNVTVTTQCQAAPASGLRAYVTSVGLSNQAATAIQLDVVYGTGTNCATGTTALTHKVQFGTNATTTSPFEYAQTYPTPLIPVAANAICVRPSAATAFGATITGYIAP